MKKRILLLSAVGIGAGLFYLLSREGRGAVAEQGNGNQQDNANGRANLKPLSSSPGNIRLIEHDHEIDNIIIDDQGTDQSEASHILQHIRDVAFDHDNEKLALALGRPAEEIEAWTSGSGVIDGDVIMKARGLALNRGVEID